MYWLCFFLSISWATFLQGAPLQISVKSRSVVLMNADTGAVLFAKDPHLQLFPASITKIATALTLLEKGGVDLDLPIAVSAEALRYKSSKKQDALRYGLEEDGTMLGGLKAGDRVPLTWLLHGMMMVSGNDAANALAEWSGGSIARFVEEMNGMAQRLGCHHTQFCNPHGLHHPDHYTTAYDMCLIARQALRIPLFRDLVSKATFRKPSEKGQAEVEIRQTNPLLRRGGAFYYPKAIGIKTGYTSRALYTLVAAATDQHRTLLVAILGSEKREDRYEDAKLLFESAFAEKKTKRSFFTEQESFRRELSAQRAVVARLGKAPMIEFYPSEEPQCRFFIHWLPLPLPIHRGQKVGEVRVVDLQGVVLAQEDLLATQEILPTFSERLLQLLK